MLDSLIDVRTIVFDLDGTLIDSLQVCTTILNRMCVERGGPIIGTDNVRPYISIGGVEMIRQVLGPYGRNPKEDIGIFREYYASFPTPIESLFEGVEETLSCLKDHGFDLGICSNKPQRLCKKVLEETNLARLFSEVVGGDVLPKAKPHASHLLGTIDFLKGKPEKTLYIGDSETDYQLALNASVSFVCVSYGYGDLSKILPSVPRIDMFRDLLPMLLPRSIVSKSKTPYAEGER